MYPGSPRPWQDSHDSRIHPSADHTGPARAGLDLFLNCLSDITLICVSLTSIKQPGRRRARLSQQKTPAFMKVVTLPAEAMNTDQLERGYFPRSEFAGLLSVLTGGATAVPDRCFEMVQLSTTCSPVPVTCRAAFRSGRNPAVTGWIPAGQNACSTGPTGPRR